jgi:hypothetical protein
MQLTRQKNHRNLQVESLEGRALMSGMAIEASHPSHAAILARVHIPKISFPSAGKNAVLNAIFGGAGHEWVTLAEKEVPNILSVVSGFESGAITQFTAPGLVFKTPNWQTGYTGFLHDVEAGTIAGAVLLKHKEIELASIQRGPFSTTPFPTYVVFAINRGAGARPGPVFPLRPALTPDALVTVEVGPDGQGNSATVTDLTTGTTVPLAPQLIQVKGPVVRVLVSAKQLPSEGFALKNYKFAVYPQLVANGTYAQTGSFLPENSMIPIGVETNVAPPKL